jgi:hypothetical protein
MPDSLADCDQRDGDGGQREMERSEDLRELRHHSAEQERDERRGRDQHDDRIDHRASGRAAQLGVAVHVGGQRADRLGQLSGRFACGHHRGEMRRELAREETAGDVNGRALRHLAVDLSPA